MVCYLDDAAQLVDVRARRDEVDLVAADVGELVQNVEQLVVVARKTGRWRHRVNDLAGNPVHIAQQMPVYLRSCLLRVVAYGEPERRRNVRLVLAGRRPRLPADLQRLVLIGDVEVTRGGA